MHRFRLRSGAAVAAATLATLAGTWLGAGPASAATWADAPWSGSGTATTTVTSDGTASDPVFDYSVNGNQGSWTFSATAKTARTLPIAWHYKGYHAWFQVTVSLQQFVIHNGQETDTTLRSAGPVNCCASPSGGFDYAGTATFALQAGDTYGFRMSGSNGDSDRRLIGTLSLSAPVSVTNPGARTGTVGVASSLQMSATGGTAPYTWSATGLPAGLSIDPSSGAISGTPSTAGTSTVTVTATDAGTPTPTTDSKTFTWTINPPAGCSSPGQKIGNPGFETGTSPWMTTPSVIGSSSAGEAPRSGAFAAWLDGYGTTHTDTLAQTVTLPAGCSNYTLSFWLHIDTAETTTTTQFDRLTVQLGSTTLATYSNLQHATGYVQRSFDVKAAAGTTVTLKFTGTEDSSLQTSFVIDDVALNVS